MSKSTTIECPTCAGQGVYCDDCLSTGSITVVGPVAVFVEELHSQLAAATARADAAEKLRQITAAKIQELLALADEYGSYCNRSGIKGAVPQTFSEWLTQQSEVQP